MTSSVVAERNPPTTELAELDRLELALRRMLDAFDAVQKRAVAAESRILEMQGALDGVRTGSLDPVRLDARVRELEAENQSLLERIRNAETLVARIQARLQFLEEER